MTGVQKREFIALATMILLGGGCLSSTQKPLGLREIEIMNFSNTPKEVSVSVTKGGDEVYDTVHNIDGSYGNKTVEIIRDWMGDRVDYEVTASTEINGTEMSASAGSDSLPGESGDKSCFRSVVIIESNDIAIAHAYYESCKLQR